MNDRLAYMYETRLYLDLKSVIQIGIVMLHSTVDPIAISCNSRIDSRFFWLSTFESEANNSNLIKKLKLIFIPYK